MNDCTFVVYGLYTGEPDNIRYVGATRKGVEKRLHGHCVGARRGDVYPVHHWIRKHGEENVHARVLSWTVDAADMFLAEVWWIAELRALGYHLLNVKAGGNGSDGAAGVGLGRKVSAQGRINIGNGARGRVKSAEERANISAGLTGRKLSASHIASIIAAQTGQPLPSLTDQHRAQQAATRLGLTYEGAWRDVLASWRECDRCGKRYGKSQFTGHRRDGRCARDVARQAD